MSQSPRTRKIKIASEIPRKSDKAQRITAAFLDHLEQKTANVEVRPLFQDLTPEGRLMPRPSVLSAGRPASARDLTPAERIRHVKHTHNSEHLQRLLDQVNAWHAAHQRRESGIAKVRGERNLLSLQAPVAAPVFLRAPQPSPSLSAMSGRSTKPRTKDPVDYWNADSVFEALSNAKGEVKLLSAKWLVARAATEPFLPLPSRSRLPAKAFLSLNDLRHLHKASQTSPLCGGPNRLPIVAISRDLSRAEDDEEDLGKRLLQHVGNALKERLPRYAKPHGNNHPADGPNDVGVFLDWVSLAEGVNPLEGIRAEVMATLFAHRLVTVYIMGEAEDECHAVSSLQRHLAQLCKRVHDEHDTWPMLVHLCAEQQPPSLLKFNSSSSPSGRASPAVNSIQEDSRTGSTVQSMHGLPVPRPVDAFVEGGELEPTLAYETLDDIETCEILYRDACTDVFGEARALDFSIKPSKDKGKSWGANEMHDLGLLLPLCFKLQTLKITGHSTFQLLPDSLGHLPPPPKRPTIRCAGGAPKGATKSRYPSLEELDLHDNVGLRRLPDSIKALCNLRIINLEWCLTLNALTESIGDLPALRQLRLKGCQVLKDLPESLSRLKPPWGQLELLDLDFCYSLEHLPTALGQVSTLQRLSLYGCRSLRHLPLNMRGMLSLHFLTLDGCLLLIGKLPTADFKLLEERGCVIGRPADPPPKCAEELPAYEFGALDAFARAMYGLDEAEEEEVTVNDGPQRAASPTVDAAQEAEASADRYAIGEMVLPDGDVYEGKYKDGLQEGHGVYTFVDGRKYDGQWVKGMMHGTGLFSYGRGNEYNGEYREGKPHGHGRRLFADGDGYDGPYVKGEREGKGTYTYSNGDTFEGEFIKGKREGKGVYHYADGIDSFEGEWWNDQVKTDSKRKIGSRQARNSRAQQSEVDKRSSGETHKALKQENDEMRVQIIEMRGAVPLVFRKPEHLRHAKLGNDEIRNENSKLAAFMQNYEHKQFLKEMDHRREAATESLRVADGLWPKDGGASASEVKERKPAARRFQKK